MLKTGVTGGIEFATALNVTVDDCPAAIVGMTTGSAARIRRSVDRNRTVDKNSSRREQVANGYVRRVVDRAAAPNSQIAQLEGGIFVGDGERPTRVVGVRRAAVKRLYESGHALNGVSSAQSRLNQGGHVCGAHIKADRYIVGGYIGGEICSERCKYVFVYYMSSKHKLYSRTAICYQNHNFLI